MTTNLTNFVAMRSTRGDLLTPVEYRTIVGALRGLLAPIDTKTPAAAYRALIAHLLNYDNPHDNSASTFDLEIKDRLYAIYTSMTTTPVSRSSFESDVLTSLSFLELLRRILLNRYLYSAVKSPDGHVPNQSQAILGNEWGAPSVADSPTVIQFPNGINNETDFIRLGQGANTAPLPLIFTSDISYATPPQEMIIWENASVAPYGDSFDNMSVELPVVSNDFIVDLWCVNTPDIPESILTLMNGTDTINVSMSPDRSFTVSLNGTNLTSQPIASVDGKIKLTFRTNGLLTVETSPLGLIVDTQIQAQFTSNRIFSLAIFPAVPESLTDTVFGVRSITISRLVSLKINRPLLQNYCILTDDDGAILTDDDGAILIEWFGLVLTDDDGTLLTDDDGSYVVQET